LEEAELVGRALAGDLDAWEPLIAAHQESIFRLAYLITADSSEAQDIAQETFIRAYRALAKFDANRPLRPWLLAIAANLSRNYLRSASRQLRAFSRHYLEGSHDSQSNQTGEQHLEAQELWKSVRKLDPAAQQIIYCRFFLDLSVDDTALAVGVPAGTVKSKLHRAVGRLRDLLSTSQYPHSRLTDSQESEHYDHEN
jgi:RNA polymerase sigma-70 factor (ECF subfamily)